MQASHVKNKVVKKNAKDSAAREKARIEGAGNAFELHAIGGKRSVPLPEGPLDVWGHWQAAGTNERAVILLGDMKEEPSCLSGLVDALARRNCQVLAPKFPGTTEKEIEADVTALIALLDWLGLAQPVIYGRDWGAIRACKFKLRHPKRAVQLVLEDFSSKINEMEYKRRMKNDPGYCEFNQSFLWFFDGTVPKTMDGTPGKNMQGFKGKVKLLWPMCSKGRHDPNGRSGILKVAEMFGKVVKTVPIDSYNMNDDDVAEHISACMRT
eukprot:gnl/MRDRNA2_/MRDRNA2_14474_c0_seq1.p1 gnl/MRDRNA2_/MRDRNA2_14474_c0~~gnl/MRDRNA2_/MRDRNA2_14474_c0_seq1.p1  ORF type:complete len:278 (+),score=57.34 gnl/MRDRNA2_/MRDRNA2_14474_c0_seq1:34-834(+)